MDNRLTQAQLAQVIAEVEQLSQRREAELNREQVQQILQEVNLPEDLLDDALVQIRRRQALAVERRRNRWIAAGALAIVLGALATTTVFVQHRQGAIAGVSTYQSRITLAQDNQDNLRAIDRQTSPKVFYRVTLKDAPLGEKLSLGCDWIDPGGQVAHQNRYQTRQIDKAVWQTHCFYQFNPASTPGTWTVQMSLGERILSKSPLLVK